MPRRNRPTTRKIRPDAVYNDTLIAKFINRTMIKGKKSLAERIFYNTMEIIKEKTKEDPVEVFKKALKNVTPLVEVKARRIGGSTYQVPVEVREIRGQTLGCTWIIKHARARHGKSMIEKLTNEILDAYHGAGASIKKREDTHKMAEANKAFAHYRF